MGDYDLKASYSADNTPVREFSGTASFNGCALFSGQVKNSEGVEAKLEGHIKFIGNQIMLNFLKRFDDESRAIEFYVCKPRDNSELLGAFSGVWRYRWTTGHSFSPGNSAYIKELLPNQDWITHSGIRENKVSIQLLPSTQPVEQTYSLELSGGEDSATIPEQDLKATPHS